MTLTQPTQANPSPRVLILVYAKNKSFLGLIPNRPDEFYNTLKQLAQQHGNITQQQELFKLMKNWGARSCNQPPCIPKKL